MKGLCVLIIAAMSLLLALCSPGSADRPKSPSPNEVFRSVQRIVTLHPRAADVPYWRYSTGGYPSVGLHRDNPFAEVGPYTS
jgi:hypothetical protein